MAVGGSSARRRFVREEERAVPLITDVVLPLGPELRRKWDAVREQMDFRVVAGGEGADA